MILDGQFLSIGRLRRPRDPAGKQKARETSKPNRTNLNRTNLNRTNLLYTVAF